MKTLKWFFLLVALIELSLAGCSNEAISPAGPADSGVLSKLIVTDFTGINYPTGYTSIGEIKEVAGLMILRNRVGTITWESTHPLIATTSGIITYNGNINAATGEGFIWGTTIHTPTAYPDVVVETTWRGKVVLTGAPEWTLTLKQVGHAKGGGFNGTKIFAENIVVYTDPTALVWTGTATGQIHSQP